MRTAALASLLALAPGGLLSSEPPPEPAPPKRQPSRGVLKLPRSRDSVPPAAVKRARRWLATHKPGDTPPGHIADTLAALNMSYGQ